MEQKEQKKKVEEQKLDQVNGGIGIPELAEEQLIAPDGKRQLSDEILAGVDGGRIPPLPEIPTTTIL
mgnify:CR=1 FL=1